MDGSPISFETVAPDAAEMASRIAATLPRYPWLVCEVGGVVAGYAYASQHRVRAAYQWAVDVAVYIDSRYHRQGLGRALYVALFRLLARQGIYNAYAGITLPNAKSVGLHEALGFVPVGVYREVGFKCGRWLDVGWWQLALMPKPAAEPPAPTPFAELRQSSGFTLES